MLAVMKSEIFNYCFRVRESESKVCPSIYAFFSRSGPQSKPKTNPKRIPTSNNLRTYRRAKAGRKKREIKDEKRNTLNCFLS